MIDQSGFDNTVCCFASSFCFPDFFQDKSKQKGQPLKEGCSWHSFNQSFSGWFKYQQQRFIPTSDSETICICGLWSWNQQEKCQKHSLVGGLEPFCSIQLGIIIPTVTHSIIFQRGGELNHQPVPLAATEEYGKSLRDFGPGPWPGWPWVKICRQDFYFGDQINPQLQSKARRHGNQAGSLKCAGDRGEPLENLGLVAGFKHGWIIFHHIWDVIPTPLTND